MVVTFTLISCVRGYLVYKDIWNLIVSETLNCEREAGSLHYRFINPRYLGFIYAYAVGLRKYGTTVGHISPVISCICTLFLRHGSTSVIEATVTEPQQYSRLTTGRSRISLPHTNLMVDCDILLFARELCLHAVKISGYTVNTCCVARYFHEEIIFTFSQGKRIS